MVCVQNFAITRHDVSEEIGPRQNKQTLKYLADLLFHVIFFSLFHCRTASTIVSAEWYNVSLTPLVQSHVNKLGTTLSIRSHKSRESYIKLLL